MRPPRPVASPGMLQWGQARPRAAPRVCHEQAVWRHDPATKPPASPERPRLREASAGRSHQMASRHYRGSRGPPTRRAHPRPRPIVNYQTPSQSSPRREVRVQAAGHRCHNHRSAYPPAQITTETRIWLTGILTIQCPAARTTRRKTKRARSIVFASTCRTATWWLVITRPVDMSGSTGTVWVSSLSPRVGGSARPAQKSWLVRRASEYD